MLTGGFKTLAPLSIDTPEAGSTCNASSIQPDDDRFNVSTRDVGDRGGENPSRLVPSASPEPPNSVMYSIFGVFDLFRRISSK